MFTLPSAKSGVRGALMRVWKQLLLSSVMAVLVTSLLVLLPLGPVQRQDASVFQPEDPTRLGLYNLVDVMDSEAWQSKLGRVNWNQGELAVDYLVPRHVQPEALSRDLLMLLQLAFIKKSNIDRLLVRFLEPVGEENSATRVNEDQAIRTTEHPGLLMAADIRRSDGELARYLERMMPSDILQPQWREHFRITVTPRWFRRFGAWPD
ncbi:hypothetical protein [Paenibacillus daejeonensis]|uniref:hypothetical protein n=1 Tax=Paenibacillus daejeonensis TaxID=135193 RepID=UPI00036DB7FC|nr:hypothetical protein [Paenibacillus daejeonensis]